MRTAIVPRVNPAGDRNSMVSECAGGALAASVVSPIGMTPLQFSVREAGKNAAGRDARLLWTGVIK